MTAENTNLMKLRGVRIAFAHGIFTPKSINNGDPKYSCTFILAKDHPQIKEIEAKVLEVATAKWGKKAPEYIAAMKAQAKYPLHDGAEKPGTKGYLGNLFINANANESDKPTVLDKDAVTPLEKGSGKPYSGCVVNASVDVWAQDNSNGKRVNFGLRGVMFKADGDKLGGGGGSADVSEFADMAEGSDDDEDLA